MKFNKENLMKEDNALADVIVEDDRAGKEVTEKVLHVVITDEATGREVTNFKTDCMLLNAMDAEEEGKEHGFVFNTASVLKFASAMKSMEAQIETLKKSNPVFAIALLMMDSYDEEEDEE